MQIILITDCRVAMVTFGNKQVWTAKAGEKFFYDLVIEQNDSFVFLQCGLNHYILEARAVGDNPLPTVPTEGSG